MDSELTLKRLREKYPGHVFNFEKGSSGEIPKITLTVDGRPVGAKRAGQDPLELKQTRGTSVDDIIAELLVGTVGDYLKQ
jgi:hypothetical protein